MKKIGNSFISVTDLINIILGVLIIISSVILLVDIKQYEKFFTVIFILASAMNICMGTKYYKRSDAPRMIALFAFAIILLVLAVASFIALWL